MKARLGWTEAQATELVNRIRPTRTPGATVIIEPAPQPGAGGPANRIWPAVTVLIVFCNWAALDNWDDASTQAAVIVPPFFIALLYAMLYWCPANSKEPAYVLIMCTSNSNSVGDTCTSFESKNRTPSCAIPTKLNKVQHNTMNSDLRSVIFVFIFIYSV